MRPPYLPVGHRKIGDFVIVLYSALDLGKSLLTLLPYDLKFYDLTRLVPHRYPEESGHTTLIWISALWHRNQLVITFYVGKLENFNEMKMWNDLDRDTRTGLR